MMYLRVYFDFCGEEYYLNKNGLIDKRVWEEWLKGIKHSLTQKPYFDAWHIATSNSNFYDEFAEWVEKDVMKK